MITSLYIKNYAIIDEIKISFSPGFNVITGETGSGKSIILGALQLILGERASAQSAYDSNSKCIIEGQFNIHSYNLKPFFQAHDLDYEEGLIIRRELLPSGKSRAFINDSPTTLSVLQELSLKLLDLHNQFDTQKISSTSFQLAFLDALADQKKEVAQYTHLYRSFRQKSEQLNQLKQQANENTARLDYLSFQLNELEEQNIIPEEDAQLEQQLFQEENKETILSTLSQASNILSSEEAITLHIHEIVRELAPYASSDPNIKDIHDRLHSAALELEDIGNAVDRQADQDEFDANKVESLRERVDQLNRLMNKHQVQDVLELLQKKSEIEEEIEDLLSGESKTQDLEKELSTLRKILTEHADTISKKRHAVTKSLEGKIAKQLAFLNMEQARFSIELTDAELGPVGKDHIRFMFSANPGSPLQPIKDVASGGELSRLALVLKSMVASAIPLPTMIFDEIDAGISGDVSHKMGSILKETSIEHQIISITHSPQIASKGDIHFKVQKIIDQDSTRTDIITLNDQQRIQEIAVMLSSDPPSDYAIQNAKELLKQS